MISSVSEGSSVNDFYVNGVPVSSQQHAALTLLDGAIEVTEQAQSASAAMAQSGTVDPAARLGSHINISV